TLCWWMMPVILVRCSVVSLADPAAPWPVVVLRFCSDWLVDDAPLWLCELFGLCAFCSLLERSVSGLPDAAGPDLFSIVWPAFSSDFGAWPVVSRALPDFASGVI